MIRAVIGSKFRILINFLKAEVGGWGRPQNSSPSHNQSFPPSYPQFTKGSSHMGTDIELGYGPRTMDSGSEEDWRDEIPPAR